jgi:hypothetical protein
MAKQTPKAERDDEIRQGADAARANIRAESEPDKHSFQERISRRPVRT